MLTSIIIIIHEPYGMSTKETGFIKLFLCVIMPIMIIRVLHIFEHFMNKLSVSRIRSALERREKG